MKSPKYYKLLMECTTLKNVEYLSTFDHIFSVPPIRIMDSHRVFSDLKKVKYLLWDINTPTDKRFKTEISIDGVFLNTNSEEYRLYDTNRIYALSDVHIPDLEKLKDEFFKVCGLIYTKRYKTRQLLMDRFEEVLKIYVQTLSNKHNTSMEFYIELLSNWYKFLSLDIQLTSIRSNLVSLYDSGITTTYIPNLIKDTLDDEMGIVKIASRNPSIFSPPFFRPSIFDEDLGNVHFNSLNREEILQICDYLECGKIVPAQEIITWSFALAGIKHVGNDYGVYSKLADYFYSDEELSELSNKQITKPKEDGCNFIKFSSPTFHYKRLGEKLKKEPSNPNRSMNFLSAFLHLGKDGLSNSINNYVDHGEVTSLTFGEIIC